MPSPAAVTQDAQLIRPCQKFEGHTRCVNGVIHLPGGQQMVTCSKDNSLRVWNLHTGKQITSWQDGNSGVNAMALSPDGKKVVSASGDGVVRLWNINTGRVIAKWKGHASEVLSVCWHRDAERVVSGSFDGTARVWDVGSGKTVLEIKTGSFVWAVVYSPDATVVVTGGKENFIQIWDANTGKLVTNLEGHRERVNCLAWTANHDGSSKTLISGSDDHSIRTWNPTTWQQIAVFTGHTDIIRGIAISLNGRILASVSFDSGHSTARLWNLEDGQPIGLPIQHTYIVTRVSISTDGKLLAAGSSDGNVYSWDISMIVREDDLDLLNPNNGDKSLLNADATQQGQRREDAHRLHPGFFDDSPHHPGPSIQHPISPSSTRHDIPSRPRFLEWARNSSFNWPRRQSGEGIELQDRRPAVVDVPLAQSRPRNYTVREFRMRKEKEKTRNAESAKKASASSSRSLQSNFTQQSVGAAQALPSPESHDAVFTSSAVAARSPMTTPSVNSPPNATIPWIGRCTCFNCCTSPQDTNGQH